MVNVHVVGMSHIDLGFTVTEEELEELLEILVERMLSVLDRHPEINYAIEQMLHYRKLQQRRPELFRRVQSYVASGRIDVMGAMASSMETNFPSGEAFIRNQLIGLNWAEEHFQVRPQAAWLVDTFGINPQIPQLLRQFGFEYLFANRFGGDKQREIFRAEGLDGSKITVIGNDLASVNNDGSYIAFRLCHSWSDMERVFDAADRLNGDDIRLVSAYIENEEVLSLHYKALTEQRKNRKEEKWFLSSYHGFINELCNVKKAFPVVSADLNPEFTGTFALRTPLKTRYRKTETLLLETEKWLNLLSPGAKTPDLEEAWWKLSFVQFHDVFSGSHGDKTYHNALGRMDDVDRMCDASIAELIRCTTNHDENSFICLNGVPWPREVWIAIPIQFANRRLYLDGQALPAVKRDEACYCKVILPANGMVSLTAHENAEPVSVKYEKTCCRIQNEYHTLTIDPSTGALSICLCDGTPLVDRAMDYLTVQEDAGGFQIESPVGGELLATSNPFTVSSVYSDPIGETLHISGVFSRMHWNANGNNLKWDAVFSLEQGKPGIRLQLTLDWYGEGTRIRFHLPTTIDRAEAIYEVPFGTVRRSAYRPRPTARGEWPAQRFVTIEDGEKGLALINTGVAGVEVNGKTLSTTLIRAYYPGPMAWVPPTAETSQHGVQTFEFMIVPYRGSWSENGVNRLAQELNTPVLCFENSAAKSHGIPLLAVKPANLAISAVKTVSDNTGEILLRIYETAGKPTSGSIYMKDAFRAYLSTVREEKGAETVCANERIPVQLEPYQILSIRVKRRQER